MSRRVPRPTTRPWSRILLPSALVSALAVAMAGALTLLGVLGSSAAAPPAEGFTVHEWGTFTSVSGSDGVLLPGLEVAEEPLPPFVYSHAGMGNGGRGKGWLRELAGVTIRMETPVLYAYSNVARRLRVEVGFRGGSISQWYPQRSGGERPPEPEVGAHGGVEGGAIDFSGQDYQGAIQWDVDVLAPGEGDVASIFRGTETLAWEYPRQVAANALRNDQGEVERYLFYRGVGNFALPLRVLADETRVYVENLSDEAIPFLMLFDHRSGEVESADGLDGGPALVEPFQPRGRVGYTVVEGLRPFESHAIERGTATSSADWRAPVFSTMVDALQRAGLFRDEAQAMVRTWWRSYFEHQGLRVFWIVPRGHVDEILPLALQPEPEALERVLVGRTEVLTPGFERGLRSELRGSDHPWSGDRFERAYRSRVAAMGTAER